MLYDIPIVGKGGGVCHTVYCTYISIYSIAKQFRSNILFLILHKAKVEDLLISCANR
jgi:hypothetical protein